MRSRCGTPVSFSISHLFSGALFNFGHGNRVFGLHVRSAVLMTLKFGIYNTESIYPVLFAGMNAYPFPKKIYHLSFSINLRTISYGQTEGTTPSEKNNNRQI